MYVHNSGHNIQPARHIMVSYSADTLKSRTDFRRPAPLRDLRQNHLPPRHQDHRLRSTIALFRTTNHNLACLTHFCHNARHHPQLPQHSHRRHTRSLLRRRTRESARCPGYSKVIQTGCLDIWSWWRRWWEERQGGRKWHSECGTRRAGEAEEGSERA